MHILDENLEKNIGGLLVKNSHAVISDLRNLFKPRKIKEGHWVRISTRGNCELCDYNSGLYSVYLKVIPNYSLKEKGIISYAVQFHVGNLDDGDIDAWSVPFNSEKEANDLVEKIAPILEDLNIIPSLKELNEILQPFGLWAEMY